MLIYYVTPYLLCNRQTGLSSVDSSLIHCRQPCLATLPTRKPRGLRPLGIPCHNGTLHWQKSVW